MNGIFPILLVVALLLPVVTFAAASGDAAMKCKPTASDSLGPFYVPDAPVRAKVGQGYVLAGTVRSAVDCGTITGAKIEFWLAGPLGGYDDDHRATLFADGSGGYRFESNFPPGYGSRPPHIHIRVSAAGFDTLVTQHYPESGKSGASFDLVLIPVR
jgi:protocatechuate 3,4-dioxygenase beta subunit